MIIPRLRAWVMTFMHKARLAWYVKLYGMDIAPSVQLGASVKLDKSNPRGIHIGPNTYITLGTLILSHDHVRGFLKADTRIGARTFVGARSMVLPGVTIGDEVIVGSGSVVTKNVPSNTVVAGNPAKVVKSGINMSRLARFVDYSALNLMVANNHLYLRGGCESIMFDEVEWLNRNGHKVNFFGGTDGRPGVLPHADLLRPASNFSGIRGTAKISAAGRLIYNRDAKRRFTAMYHRIHPDLVHCHNIYGGLTTSVLDVCRSKRVPAVITLHDYKLACPSYTMLRNGSPCSKCAGRNYYHCVFGRCHRASLVASLVYTAESYFNELLGKYFQATFLIAPSKFMADRMVDHGVPSEKLRTIPNGVDCGRLQPCYSDEGYALYLGRLSREKGVGTMLQAARGLSMPLKIVGDGPERSALERLAREYDLSQVLFDGYKSGEELEAVVRGAAFLVVPSEWYENAPMSVLEAMAYGKPVIAARIGGIPEQVEDGVTGLLFDSGDSDALSRALHVLESDPERRRAMGHAARQRVEEHFSLDLHCKRLMEVYKEAIRG